MKSTVKSRKTRSEQNVGRRVADVFERCGDSTETKLAGFPKYVRRHQLKRFLALYELYKMIVEVKGSIVECGVYRGFGYMSWLKLASILEPENLSRMVYGFDTFAGFPSIAGEDTSRGFKAAKGALAANSLDELLELTRLNDDDRFIGHIPKGELIKGDLGETAPSFLRTHPHLVVSLLYLDCDLYEPTKVALETFVPRMPRGAILAFDELDHPHWPGETLALLETMGIGNVELRRLPWDPYISYARIGHGS